MFSLPPKHKSKGRYVDAGIRVKTMGIKSIAKERELEKRA